MLATQGVQVKMGQNAQVTRFEFKSPPQCCAMCFGGQFVADRMIGPDDRGVRCRLIGRCKRTTGPRPLPEAGGGACATRASGQCPARVVLSGTRIGVRRGGSFVTAARTPTPNPDWRAPTNKRTFRAARAIAGPRRSHGSTWRTCQSGQILSQHNFRHRQINNSVPPK